jgi:membrane-associated protein
VTLLGASLGNVEFVRSNLEVILLAIVAVSVIPIGVELLRGRAQARRL